VRIEKLNKDKIKVTLTTAELINLDIDVKRLSPDSKELHTFLFHIMETIREETGFNIYSFKFIPYDKKSGSFYTAAQPSNKLIRLILVLQ
jgi:negative regulator of genetic competence, sporulation and motility